MHRKLAKTTLTKHDGMSCSIWQLPSSTRFESGCSSADRWCLPAGSWPSNYYWRTSRPILSCTGEENQRMRRFMSFSIKTGHRVPPNISSGNKAGGWSRPTKYGTPALEKYSPVWERGWLRLGVRSAVNWPSWWNRQHKHFISNTMDWLIFFTASISPISYVFQTM